jgi:hypothetical protein
MSTIARTQVVRPEGMQDSHATAGKTKKAQGGTCAACLTAAAKGFASLACLAATASTALLIVGALKWARGAPGSSAVKLGKALVIVSMTGSTGLGCIAGSLQLAALRAKPRSAQQHV